MKYRLKKRTLNTTPFSFSCQDCSLFYTKRFCMECVNKHLDQFPHQIQAELAKKKPPRDPKSVQR